MIDPREVIVWRLERLKERYMPEASYEEFAKEIGLDKSRMSEIRKMTRGLPFESGCVMKEKWGISLDWLFYGDLQLSAFQIMASIGQRPITHEQSKTSKRRPG